MAECTDCKTAERYMDALMTYHVGGWAAFFGSVNKSREENDMKLICTQFSGHRFKIE